MLKAFLFSFIAILSFSLSGCSSSNNDDAPTNNENNSSSDVNRSDLNQSTENNNSSSTEQNNSSDINDSTSSEINNSVEQNQTDLNNSEIKTVQTDSGQIIKVYENNKYKVIAREDKTIVLNFPSSINRVSQSLKRKLKAVTDTTIANVTLSIFYPDNSAYFQDQNFTDVNGSWTMKIIDFPIIEEQYRFVVNVYNQANQKIMTGEVNQTLTDETLNIIVPIQFIEETQIALPTIQNVVVKPPLNKDGNVTVTFQVSNPSRDSINYLIAPIGDNNLSNFFKADGTDGKSGTINNSLTSEFSVYIPNNFIKDREYKYYITLISSNGNKIRQIFTILISIETVSPNLTIQTPPISKDVFIELNDNNITVEAVFDTNISQNIKELNWSLANNSFNFINNKSNPAVIIGFDGNISDTLILTILDKNGSLTVETFVLNLNDSIAPQIPIINSYSNFVNKTTTNISISGEPSTKVVINGNLTSNIVSVKGLSVFPVNLSLEGENNISIALEDLNGNRSDEVNISIKRDTTPPKTNANLIYFETSSLSPEFNGSLPSAVGDDNISKYRVEILINNEIKNAIVYGSKWGIPASTFSELNEGYYDINITVYDEINNSATTNLPNAFRISYSGFITKPLIEGLYYVSGSKTGKTNISGLFKYENNETLSLSLGNSDFNLEFGSLNISNFLEINGTRKEINFLKLINSSNVQDSQRARNIIRLLASLDADKDLSNGIIIDNETAEAFIIAKPDINFDVNDSNFSAQTEISIIFNDLSVHFGEHRGLISAEDSQAIVTALINGTIANPVYSADPEANISILQGVLKSIEGAVEGIAFRSGSQSGFTDENGTFSYEDGKKIRFSIGMMELSETKAKSVMSPYDLVESVSFDHPKPRNIASLFSLFDAINNDSKITIDQPVRDAIDKYRAPIDLNLPDGQANEELNISAGLNEFMAQFNLFEIGNELLTDINDSRVSNNLNRNLSNLTRTLHSTSSLADLQALQVSANPIKQVEKIYNNVKDFHIFLTMLGWNEMDVTTMLINGDAGIPIFSPRSEPNPIARDYPINYNKPIERYKPVSPPASVKDQYSIEQLGNKETATYNPPIVSAGIVGKGRVLAMSSYLYASILVNPRNYSMNLRNNNKTATPDSADMENFFHNVFSWLSESNSKHYDQNGSKINIATNKEYSLFWHYLGWDYKSDRVPFVIHSNYNINQVKITDLSQLDPEIYPIFILEEFGRHYSSSIDIRYLDNSKDLNYLLEYLRKGGSILIMDSFYYEKEPTTIVEKILDKAGIYIVRDQHNSATFLSKHTEVGGVHQYDMCVQDYFGLTDLERKLGLTTYENVPTTKDSLIDALKTRNLSSWEGNLDELLKKRERVIFKIADENTTFVDQNCVVAQNTNSGIKNVQTQLVKGDGIPGDGSAWYQFDKYAKYPVDLNFVDAQGDMSGKMNSLLDHEDKIKIMKNLDVEREYTNMYALLMNDANFSGDKFIGLNNLLNIYKDINSSKVNNDGEFDPIYRYGNNGKVLNYREKPVTRIMLERAFYDSSLKIDPSEFPGKVTGGKTATTTIYLKKISEYAQWYARNMQSTALFAPANKEITITAPNNIDLSKLQVQIAMSDNVSGLIKHELVLKRPPRMVKKYSFESQTLKIIHPYGGLIYIASNDNNPNSETAIFNFDGVEKAILFKLDETTESDWTNMKTSALAPIGEIQSRHFIVTVPKENLAYLTFAEIVDIAKGFDEVAINSNDFYGFDRNCSANISDFYIHTPPTCETRKGYQHREVFDPHISIGAGHSGYPIMIMEWDPFSHKFPQNPRNSFLLWHELGHNTAVNWLTIPGTGEVATNVMALYQQHKFNLPLQTEKSMLSSNLIVDKSQSYADSGAMGRLLMFTQIPLWTQENYLDNFKLNNSKYYEINGSIKSGFDFLDGSSWDIYKIMHREARENNSSANYRYSACAENNNLTVTESFATCISSILKLDLTDFMESWEAGTVGIGAIDGENIYDSSGGFGSAGKTAISNMNLPQPSSPIQNYSGN